MKRKQYKKSGYLLASSRQRIKRRLMERIDSGVRSGFYADYVSDWHRVWVQLGNAVNEQGEELEFALVRD